MFENSKLKSFIDTEPGKRTAPTPHQMLPRPETESQLVKRLNSEIVNLKYENGVLMDKLDKERRRREAQSESRGVGLDLSTKDVSLGYNAQASYVRVLQDQLAQCQEMLEAKDSVQIQKSLSRVNSEFANVLAKLSELRSKYDRLKARYFGLQNTGKLNRCVVQTAREMRKLIKAYQATGFVDPERLAAIDFEQFDSSVEGVVNKQPGQLAYSKTDRFRPDDYFNLSDEGEDEALQAFLNDPSQARTKPTRVASLINKGVPIREPLFNGFDPRRERDSSRPAQTSLDQNQGHRSRAESGRMDTLPKESALKVSERDKLGQSAREREASVKSTRLGADLLSKKAKDPFGGRTDSETESRLSRHGFEETEEGLSAQEQSERVSRSGRGVVDRLKSEKSLVEDMNSGRGGLVSERVEQSVVGRDGVENKGVEDKGVEDKGVEDKGVENKGVEEGGRGTDDKGRYESVLVDDRMVSRLEAERMASRLEAERMASKLEAEKMASKLQEDRMASKLETEKMASRLPPTDQQTLPPRSALDKNTLDPYQLKLQLEVSRQEHMILKENTWIAQQSVEGIEKVLMEAELKHRAVVAQKDEQIAILTELNRRHLAGSRIRSEQASMLLQSRQQGDLRSLRTINAENEVLLRQELDDLRAELLAANLRAEEAVRESNEARIVAQGLVADNKVLDNKVRLFTDRLERISAEQRVSMSRILASNLNVSRLGPKEPLQISAFKDPSSNKVTLNQSEVGRLEAYVNRVHELEALNSMLVQTKIELEDRLAELEQLRAHNDKAEEALRNSLVEFEKQGNHLVTANRKVELLQKEVGNFVSRLVEAKREAEELRALAKELEEDNTALRRECDGVLIGQRVQADDLEDAQAEAQAARELQKALEAEVIALTAKTLSLEKQLRGADQEKRMTLSRLGVLSNEKDRMVEAVADLRTSRLELEKSQLQVTVSEKDRQLGLLQDEIGRLGGEVQELQNLMAVRKEKVRGHIKQSFSKVDKDRAELAEEVRALNEVVRVREDELGKANDRVDKAVREAREAADGLLMERLRSAKLSEETDRLTAKVSRLERFGRAFENMEQSQDGVRAAYLRIDDLQAQVGQLEAQAARALVEAQTAKAEVSQKAVELGFLEEEHKRLKERLVEVGPKAREADSLREQVGQQRQQLAVLEQDNEALKQQGQDMSRRLEQLTREGGSPSAVTAERLRLALLEQQLQHSESEALGLKAKLEEQSVLMAKASAAFAKDLTDKDRRVSILEARVGNFKKISASVKGVDELMEHKDTQIFELIRLSNHRKEDIDRLAKEVARVTAQLAESQSALAQARQKGDAHTDPDLAVDRLIQAQLREFRLKHHVKDEHAGSVVELMSLYSRLDELNSRIEALISGSDAEQTINALRSKLALSESQAADKDRRIALGLDTVDKLESRVRELERQHEFMTVANAQLTEKLEDRTRQAVSHVVEYKNELFANKEKSGVIAGLRQTIADLERKLLHKEVAYRNLQEFNIRTDVDESAHSEQLKLLRTRNEALQEQVRWLGEQLAQHQGKDKDEEVQFMRRQENLAAQIEAQQDTVKGLEDRVAQLLEDLERKQDKNASLKDRVRDLQEQLGQALADAAAAERKYEAISRVNKHELGRLPELEEFIQLRSANDSLSEEVKRLRDAKVERLMEVEAENAKLRTRMSALSETDRKGLAQMLDEDDRLRLLVRERDRELAELRESFDKETDRLGRAMSELREQEALARSREVEPLLERVARLEGLCQQRGQLLEDRDKEVAELKDQLRDAVNARQVTTNMLELKEAELHVCQVELEAKGEENGQMRQGLEKELTRLREQQDQRDLVAQQAVGREGQSGAVEGQVGDTRGSVLSGRDQGHLVPRGELGDSQARAPGHDLGVSGHRTTGQPVGGDGHPQHTDDVVSYTSHKPSLKEAQSMREASAREAVLHSGPSKRDTHSQSVAKEVSQQHDLSGSDPGSVSLGHPVQSYLQHMQSEVLKGMLSNPVSDRSAVEAQQGSLVEGKANTETRALADTPSVIDQPQTRSLPSQEVLNRSALSQHRSQANPSEQAESNVAMPESPPKALGDTPPEPEEHLRAEASPQHVDTQRHGSQNGPNADQLVVSGSKVGQPTLVLEELQKQSVVKGESQPSQRDFEQVEDQHNTLPKRRSSSSQLLASGKLREEFVDLQDQSLREGSGSNRGSDSLWEVGQEGRTGQRSGQGESQRKSGVGDGDVGGGVVVEGTVDEQSHVEEENPRGGVDELRAVEDPVVVEPEHVRGGVTEQHRVEQEHVSGVVSGQQPVEDPVVEKEHVNDSGVQQQPTQDPVVQQEHVNDSGVQHQSTKDPVVEKEHVNDSGVQQQPVEKASSIASQLSPDKAPTVQKLDQQLPQTTSQTSPKKSVADPISLETPETKQSLPKPSPNVSVPPQAHQSMIESQVQSSEKFDDPNAMPSSTVNSKGGFATTESKQRSVKETGQARVKQSDPPVKSSLHNLSQTIQELKQESHIDLSTNKTKGTGRSTIQKQLVTSVQPEGEDGSKVSSGKKSHLHESKFSKKKEPVEEDLDKVSQEILMSQTNLNKDEKEGNEDDTSQGKQISGSSTLKSSQK
jgi:chromosome segregation ATPase